MHKRNVDFTTEVYHELLQLCGGAGIVLSRETLSCIVNGFVRFCSRKGKLNGSAFLKMCYDFGVIAADEERAFKEELNGVRN